MKRRFWTLLFLVIVLIFGGLWYAAAHARLSALDEPGSLETYAATKAKRWLVGRAARGLRVSPPNARSVTLGGMQFRARCASCHGLDGRTPTEIGHGLYPRTPDLGLPRVRQWSDAELFWIIKNGIRLTGMPAFGKALSDEEIWPLVYYIRSLTAQPASENSSPGDRRSRDGAP